MKAEFLVDYLFSPVLFLLSSFLCSCDQLTVVHVLMAVWWKIMLRQCFQVVFMIIIKVIQWVETLIALCTEPVLCFRIQDGCLLPISTLFKRFVTSEWRSFELSSWWYQVFYNITQLKYKVHLVTVKTWLWRPVFVVPLGFHCISFIVLRY